LIAALNRLALFHHEGHMLQGPHILQRIPGHANNVERIHALFARGCPQRKGARLHEFTYVLAVAARFMRGLLP
jgi:hypothetical protein